MDFFHFDATGLAKDINSIHSSTVDYCIVDSLSFYFSKVVPNIVEDMKEAFQFIAYLINLVIPG